MLVSRVSSAFVKRDGSLPLTSNWDVGAKQLKNLADPTGPQDATTQSWVLAHGGGGAGDLLANGTVPLTANWGIANHRITGAQDPVDPQDYATMAFVLANAPGGVILADGTVPLTADWDVDGWQITGGDQPTGPTSFTIKDYVDNYADNGDASVLATVSATYLTLAAAAATYLTIATASATYLTQANAASTYVPLTRTVTGTAPITVNAVNTAVALSSNLTVAIVDASNSAAGAVSTGAQTFAGAKTFNGGVVIATGQNVSGAAELNLNAATGNNVNVKINNVTVAFFGSDGSLQMGTSVTPALPNVIVFKNNAGFIGLTNGGTQTVMMALGTNDVLAVGDPNTAKAVRIQSGLRLAWRNVADAATNILETDGTVAYTSLTATRIATLPVASTVAAGFRVQVIDAAGLATNAIRISVVPPSGTIQGAASVDISVPYGQLVFASTGSAWVLA